MLMYSAVRTIVLIWLMMVMDWNCCKCQNDFYGTVELVKHAPRRSRLLSDFVVGERVPKSVPLSVPATPSTTSTESIDDTSTLPPVRPTIDTLKRYARIFKMDTKNLTEQQRILLERIVERVARLGGSLEDIDNAEASDANDIVGNEGRARQRNVRKNANKKTKTDDNHHISIETTQPTPTAPTSTKTIKRATAGIIAHKAKGGKSKVTQANEMTMSNVTAVDLGNITTTSIVNILSTDNARENVFARRPSVQPPSLSPHEKIVPATNSKTPSVKPTKYHFYPHNQHIYLLPECAIQQVCNAVYVRLNYTQPLCACPARYRDPCSASINEDDLHTTKLIGDQQKKAITLAKTCESTTEMRECRSPRDWSLLALQNTRTGKSHYLVICRCPDNFNLEGPMAHDQPTYASVPGIRVFGMMCVKPSGFNSAVYRRPLVPQPPKRNQQFQVQSPYYQRYKKHATVKPTPQSKTDVSSQSNDYSEFTTRGLSTSEPETREGEGDIDLDEITEERTSTLEATATTSLDSTSPTTTSTMDATIETTEGDDNLNSRVKRMIDAMDAASDNIATEFDMDDDDNDDVDAFLTSSRRQSRNTADWPDIPWDEVSQQIQQIQWD